ncbi:PREDICTED: probable insulin-like peptide 1 [Drosophila arizonae]|uniref:Probable insulin-like peptide 1 n=1 Tax=Drosophila arizonae TaxID=7263 RepID=A0ABM1P3I2_DROAR|nr:PREDICTED: probable insulin-like peptide 1 [Drosophila arizonae]
MLYDPHATATGRRQRLCLLLLLLIALGSCCCSASNIALLLREGKHKLCGPALNEAMDMVCVNGYNTIPMERDPRLEPSHQGFALSPLLSSLYGAEVLIKTRRLRRQGGGIYDECCRNSCTRSELLAYCR